MYDEIINPFIMTPPNQCEYCGGEYVLIYLEATLFKVDSKGFVNRQVSDNRVSRKFRCTKCGTMHFVHENEDGSLVPSYIDDRCTTPAISYSPFGNYGGKEYEQAE